MTVKFLVLTVSALSAFTALTACARAPDIAGDGATVAAPPTAQATPAIAERAAGVPVQSAAAKAPRMVVHKSASCGCCGLWVEHMQAAGFAVDVRNADDVTPVKQRLGVPYGKGSCHTAEIGGYFIEGHVPADDVKRLLAEQPDAKGLVVPGMPAGSPGMELPDGTTETYMVELVKRDGSVTEFARH